MAAADRYHRVLKPYIVSGPNDKGEYRARCPLHDDKNPSATFNFEKGVWHCNADCGGGSLRELVADVERDRRSADDGVADYDPFGGNVVDIESARAKKQGVKRAPLNEGIVKGWHEHLLANRELLDAFMAKRGLTLETVKTFELGYERTSGRYTIPVRDAEGNLVNVRRYKPDADSSQKMWNLTGYGSPPRLYPIAEMAHEELLVVEGELDALVAIQHGFHAVTGTGGASRWDGAWSKLFEGKRVYLCYDNDKNGRIGAKKAARSLAAFAGSVRVVPPLVPGVDKSDITDYFLAGGTAEGLQAALAAADTHVDQASEVDLGSATSVQVIGSMDSRTNGKPLHMAVTITGKRNPTYSVPALAEMACTMDAGPKCKVCPMAQEWEGEHKVDILATEVQTISRFIDANEDKTLELLRKHIGAAKCNRLSFDLLDSHTVEEVFVTSSVDKRSHEGADYTQRRVYNIGPHDTPTNTTANLTGTTWPSPKDRRNEFFSWKLEEATTSIDNFRVTPEMVKRLKVFQPAEGQSPLDKCREIAQDLSSNVTKIIGRERLHIAMDLTWHSLLHFPLDDKVISRGWIEFIVVGDTRTGKSETAIRLADHYGLGHVVGCEGATFAGLVGAVKQIGDAWTVTWGEITLNDRRLVVLDEASGLSQELIGSLSDVRSRGMAQLTKVESQQTRARTRMIWISNPRKNKFVDEKKVDGIDVLEDLIGNPEDIARFDFAMSVSMKDVESKAINNPDKPTVPHVYTSDLCHELVLWAWSRRPEHVQWKPDAYREVYRAAEWLGDKYVDHPPLVQRTNVREKIARIAVALAARTFSTDDIGECLVVDVQHVKDAVNFLHRIYSYDNFGYYRMSRRIKRNRTIAKQNRTKIKRWLLENPRVLEFLQDRRGSFRSQDLEEMAGYQRDEAQVILTTLSDAKMISKEKSQIIIEPELHNLLRSIER